MEGDGERAQEACLFRNESSVGLQDAPVFLVDLDPMES
jgi:hypothetical protein